MIDKLKETMTDIENSISVFKDTQHQRYEICFCRDVLSRSFLSNTRLSSFEELLKEERTFSQEICAFEKKMDSWSLPVKAEVRRPRSDEKSDWRNLPPELTALQTFLQQTGGRHGGWDEFDHHSFLKVWTKHGGKPSFRREARLYLPGRTEEDVRLHEEWFVELRRLQERQREVRRSISSSLQGFCDTTHSVFPRPPGHPQVESIQAERARAAAGQRRGAAGGRGPASSEAGGAAQGGV